MVKGLERNTVVLLIWTYSLHSRKSAQTAKSTVLVYIYTNTTTGHIEKRTHLLQNLGSHTSHFLTCCAPRILKGSFTRHLFHQMLPYLYLPLLLNLLYLYRLRILIPKVRF